MSEEHGESIFRKDKPILIGKHSAVLKMGNNHSWDTQIFFHYTSLKVQKVQLVPCEQSTEFSFSFCFSHRATDLRASLTIGPCDNHPKINPACANTFKTGRTSESHRKEWCTCTVRLFGWKLPHSTCTVHRSLRANNTTNIKELSQELATDFVSQTGINLQCCIEVKFREEDISETV